jgi:amino acid adenylation domain-containing protein
LTGDCSDPGSGSNAIFNPPLSPLTPMQWGMLHDSVLAGLPGNNVEQLVCHFDDQPIDPDGMSRIWNGLAQRHPILRCVCDWRDVSEPQLRCLGSVDVRVAVEDHHLLEASKRTKWLNHWLEIDRERGVDVQAGPAWRVTWLVWDDRHSSMVWTLHHLFLDGPSFAALLQEALREYQNLHGGQTHPPAVHQAPLYTVHASALASRRADPQAQAAAALFFGQMLEGVPVVSANAWADVLPGSPDGTFASERGQSSQTEIRRTRLEDAALKALDSLCRSAGVTLATAVQTAWGVVLSRWTGRSDVVFGVTRSGRHLVPNLKDTLGCLINTLPVKLSLQPGQSVGALLDGMRRTMVELRPHEHVALSDIRRWCNLDSAAQLLDSTVLFEPEPFHRRMQRAGFEHLRFELHERGAAELSLMAYLDDGLDLRLEHDTARIGVDMAQRILDSLRDVLRCMAEGTPETPVASLRSSTEAETNDLARWSFPESPVHVVDSCVASRFEARARANPDRQALSVAGSQDALSYAALDAAAGRLANWFKEHDIGLGDRVAISLERGPSFVIAMLAVMKAGAAWVPVDPTYPADLIEHMVTDSRCRLLLTSRRDRPPPRGPVIAFLEDVEQELTHFSPESPTDAWPIDRPAYVIYTSGSTGKPKGVVVSHRALASHAEAIIGCYELQAHDRILQFASLSFDVSIEEIVPTLLVGAELVLRHAAAAESVSALLQMVADRRLTVLNLPTAYWHTCVEQMGLSGLTLPGSVRLVVVGGEKASRSMLERWLQMQPRLRWINAYGPTEATISCTCFEPESQDGLPPGPDVPIGRPLGHARTVVLAADGSLAPPGARGELYVGGPCLADGYLGLPDATEQRFVSTADSLDPLLARWGLTRLYRTGDEVCWDMHGQLHYLGRHDRQVKVRGFRIELRAVETALEGLPTVSQAVVSVDRAGEPDARLLAWVQVEPGQQMTQEQLDAALADVLPGFMRPAIKFVTEWPTTPGGKVDVRRLPPHQATPAGVPTVVDMTDEVRRMVQVFAEVLKSDAVHAQASFFDLGGHSLLAVSLIGAIEREFGKTVTTGLLKAHPSPQALWTALCEEGTAAGPKYLVAIQPSGHRMPLYAVHSLGHQERFFRPLSEHLGTGQPVYGLSTGYTHMHAANLSVQDMAQLYLDDIQKHQPEGPLVLAAVSMCAFVAFELAQQLTAAGRQVECMVLFDSDGPDGRPPLKGRLSVLKVHWTQLRRRGPIYLLERLALRLTQAGGWTSRLGLSLGRRLDITQAQHYDHPADVIFVERLHEAVRQYVPQVYPGRMLIFYPEDEAFFDLEEAKQTGLGWHRFCSGNIDLVSTPGQHISMLSEPHVRALAEHLEKALDARRSSDA